MNRDGTDRRDEFELLCERCGYCIEGLPRETNCPECGRPVETSLPDSRPGSAWQQRRGLGAWAATNVQAVARPRWSMRQIAIEETRSRSLRRINLAVASGLVVLGPALVYGAQLLRRSPHYFHELTWPWAESIARWVLLAAVVLIAWGCAAGVFWALTEIESRGIRLFSRLQRSRITPTVALSITSHATAGWVAASVLMVLGFAIGLALHDHAMRNNVGAVRGVFLLGPIWIPVIWGLLGLLCFETVVYIGVLNCRFANRGEASPPLRAPSASSGDSETARQRGSESGEAALVGQTAEPLREQTR